jgi:hypothetical protein
LVVLAGVVVVVGGGGGSGRDVGDGDDTATQLNTSNLLAAWTKVARTGHF